ncbi:hypothetical protein B5M09_001828 [Aphanomyces astaci]|uniref:GAF domain-containing protein n=1 Tax=Aphanomyces astaci TaxID=112090 RepID=A0A397FW58_APHAT|nr:hypothetical protein DYB36_005771 [Aphanomyces astaci]RHY74807.1 hypothetical protein DYB34_009124 [Aphanomyces astaci]RHZ39892.1 hypothetical protein DYB31_002024 [Aphanomyces astaci]RQM22932.1 hypothetical protein B5M09_001828 [Aphanomyces astaci]
MSTTATPATQTAEGGEEYLNSMNFRSLIEWFTAEALLSRPEDPLAFVRTVISEKLAQRNGQGQVVGVMQALNRSGNEKDTGFTDMDEEVMTILAAQAGIAIQNAQNHKTALQAQKKVTEVLDIVKAMHSDLGINSLIFTVTHRIQRLVGSDRCSLYLLDKVTNELWTLQGEVDIRIPSNQGICGAVAESGKLINLKNAYEDARFNKYDQKLGYKTSTILALPLHSHKQDVIGVMQLINKTDGIFTPDDEEILTTFLSIAGPILENSPLFLRAKGTGGENELTGRPVSHGKPVTFDPEMNQIQESDGAEDEE